MPQFIYALVVLGHIGIGAIKKLPRGRQPIADQDLADGDANGLVALELGHSWWDTPSVRDPRNIA